MDTSLQIYAPQVLWRTQVAASLAGVPSVLQFGAKGDNSSDDTTAIQAAINAVAAFPTGGQLYFPAGIYKISTALIVPKNTDVYLLGDGPGATIIRQSGAAANGIQFSRDNFIAGGGIHGLTVEAGAGLQTAHFFGTGSSGTGIQADGMSDLFAIENVGVNNFTNAVSLLGCWNGRHRAVNIKSCAGIGVLIDKSGTIGVAGGNLLNGFGISNAGFTGDNSASIGVRIRATGGEYLNVMAAEGYNQGWVIDPRIGDLVLYLFGSQLLADDSTADGWTFDGSNGLIAACRFEDLWAGFNGGNGVTVKGANVANVRATVRLRENAGHGLALQAGGFACEGGTINNNSRLSSNTNDGVNVSANVSNWSVQDTFVGNDGSSSISFQRRGFTIAAGTSDNYAIEDCNVAGNLTAAISNAGTGVNTRIQGNLPVATAGLNVTGATILFASSNGPIAPASTVFVGATGQNGAENPVIWRANRAGVITNLQVYVDTAPGAGQTFTYTLRVAGSDTAITGTISGGASFTLSVNGAVAVAIGDAISVKVVTTATAALANHGLSLRME